MALSARAYDGAADVPQLWRNAVITDAYGELEQKSF
jgi:hypothetical protein